MSIIYTRGGWRAGRTGVEHVGTDLSELDRSVTKEHVAVLQLLDNVAHNVMTSEDTVILCRKDNEDKYHVDGDIMPSPPELLQPFLRNCLPIFTTLCEPLIIILVPLPRYMTAPCCADSEHAPNKADPGYRKTILSGLNRLRNTLGTTSSTMGYALHHEAILQEAAKKIRKKHPPVAKKQIWHRHLPGPTGFTGRPS
jgi:hypothetical protein